ncbi:MAG: prolyl oligopeptidase family serine peptidase [Chloroflexota bacterium]|nr:prolyl oligopeptidase family serine peptidase [Chloroflexota bacterium]MDE2960071.1 prolyl oligopeptidase family serine peptidase [Chloroflexota bacterium]
MNSQIAAPYGSWKSPITLDMVAHGTVNLLRIALDGSDTYWAEVRPTEDGRAVIVKRDAGGDLEDVTPPGFSVGSMVNEYGARSFTVADGVVYFSNDPDQRVYLQRQGEAPTPITPAGDFRYGSKLYHRRLDRIICIRENHTDPDEEHPLSEIIAIDVHGLSEPAVLLADNDFHSSPCLSSDGTQLAWLTWDHPNMPWDGTELWTARLNDDLSLEEPVQVAGGLDEAVIQPEWSPNGDLYFISDRTDWANLYRWRDGAVEPVCPMDAEFARSNWWVGMCSYGFDSPNSLICSYSRKGHWSLARIGLDDLRLAPIDFPYWEMGHGDLQVGLGRIVLVAGSPVQPLSLLQVSLEDGGIEALRVEYEEDLPPEYTSLPETIEFPTDNDETAHAFFYPPANRDYVAPEGERPPMVVVCHGGPHSAASAELNLTTQYWTSRGVAVLDVNYGGSTGYGRHYRERLIGEWGVVDVDDCVNAALHVVGRGDADGDRTAISGGSAGGFTALAALAFRDVFKAGASYFGVSDLEALLSGIHKFDAHSLVGLVGPYPLYRRRYVERSPINFPEYTTCPVIFFQGLEDTIVPAIQSEEMFNTLKANGVPTAYLAFEGEHHGFRMADTIMRCLSAEFYFYSRIFGFEPADDLEPVAIENLDRRATL